MFSFDHEAPTGSSSRYNAQQRLEASESPTGSDKASNIIVLPRTSKEATSNQTPSRKPRIALYSHDTMGLGHMRRNLLISQALASSDLQAVILMIAGARRACDMAFPPGVDCLSLPALHKAEDGQYRSRRLDVSLEELIAVRAKTIRAAIESFAPDVFIVDNVPRGAVRELDSTFKYLKEYFYSHGRTRCVLGLREILDDPLTVQREWRRAANEDAIRKYFDAVWVYGDRAVYDLVREYRFPPDVASKVRYVGYLDQQMRLKYAKDESADPVDDLELPPGQLVLCSVGGGQDGVLLADAFSQAELPPGVNGVILTGPFMSQDAQRRLNRRAAKNDRLRVADFISEPTRLMQRADRVITMGGYNTVSEILSFEKRALIVPRVKPRREQWIRAQRLHELGIVDVLHPQELSPAALSEWISRDLGPTPQVRNRLDLNGLTRLPQLVRELLETSSYSAWNKPQEERRDRNVAG